MSAYNSLQTYVSDHIALSASAAWGRWTLQCAGRGGEGKSIPSFRSPLWQRGKQKIQLVCPGASFTSVWFCSAEIKLFGTGQHEAFPQSSGAPNLGSCVLCLLTISTKVSWALAFKAVSLLLRESSLCPQPHKCSEVFREWENILYALVPCESVLKTQSCCRTTLLLSLYSVRGFGPGKTVDVEERSEVNQRSVREEK